MSAYENIEIEIRVYARDLDNSKLNNLSELLAC